MRNLVKFVIHNDWYEHSNDTLPTVHSHSHKQDEHTLKRQHSFKWAQYVNPAKSPTKQETESPNPSPHQMEHDVSQARSTQHNPIQSGSSASQRNPVPSTAESPGSQPLLSARTNRQESSDNLKSFKVSLEDPTWKVLPAALKKYKINNDNWQNYAMFICYGSPGTEHPRYIVLNHSPYISQEIASNDVLVTMRSRCFFSKN